MAYGQTFELHWHHLLPSAGRLFYEQSPESARKAMEDPECQKHKEFMDICQEVIDGKPLRPVYLDVDLADLRCQFPNVDIRWLTFSGFERDIYATSNVFLALTRKAIHEHDKILLDAKPGLL